MQEQPPILHREDRVHRERDWGIEYYNNISIYVISNAIRTPFQGDFLVRVDPRAEALGCFLCALRAIGTHTRKSPNYRVGKADTYPVRTLIPLGMILGNHPRRRRVLQGKG